MIKFLKNKRVSLMKVTLFFKWWFRISLRFKNIAPPHRIRRRLDIEVGNAEIKAKAQASTRLNATTITRVSGHRHIKLTSQILRFGQKLKITERSMNPPSTVSPPNGYISSMTVLFSVDVHIDAL